MAKMCQIQKLQEIVLAHCNIVNNDYQQNSKVLCTIIPNKSFGQLLDFFPKKNYIFKNILFRIFIQLNKSVKFQKEHAFRAQQRDAIQSNLIFEIEYS